MKHAYLILAHHEFPVLACLLKSIDDPRNDIFIHVDKKVQHLPELNTQYAKLYFTESRIDVRWGDVSVVESEFILFEAAAEKGAYDYYHLLSGVDLPLCPQNEIHQFFARHQGKEFIGFSSGDLRQHIDRKMNRYHLFPRHFRPSKTFKGFLLRALRYIFLQIQYLFGIRRNKNINFKKGTQWVSITHEFLSYALQHKNQVLQHCANTFCSDEIFMQTLCWNSPFREQIFNLDNELLGCQRNIGWKNGVLIDWTNHDDEELLQAGVLFARKFNSNQMEVVHRIMDKINTPYE